MIASTAISDSKLSGSSCSIRPSLKRYQMNEDSPKVSA